MSDLLQGTPSDTSKIYISEFTYLLKKYISLLKDEIKKHFRVSLGLV